MDGEKIKKTVANIPSLKTVLLEFTSLKKIIDNKNNNLSNFWNDSATSAKTTIKVESLSGCLFALQKDDFTRIGMFDENFFLYLEDLDFFSRAALLNYSTMFIPKVLGRHFEGGSSRHSAYKIDVNAWNNSKKHYVKKQFGIIGTLLCIAFSLDNFLIGMYKLVKQ